MSRKRHFFGHYPRYLKDPGQPHSQNFVLSLCLGASVGAEALKGASPPCSKAEWGACTFLALPRSQRLRGTEKGRNPENAVALCKDRNKLVKKGATY